MPSALSAKRFWLTNLFISSLFLILGYQGVQLTLIRRQALLDLAKRQHLLSVQIPPLRGQILDRKARELAANLKVPSIYAVPRMIESGERQQLAFQIHKVLGLDQDFIRNRISRDKSFVWLKRSASPAEAEKIKNWGHPAFGIVEEYKRFYPQGDLLAQVLGFTDIDNQGLEGIEFSLHKALQGRAGKRYSKRDALGREIRAFEIRQIPAVNGSHVTLTIDQYVQYLTERALDRAWQQWKPKGAFAVVMEAQTGRILAMANRPTFDLNAHETSSADSRRNRAITDMYEPGSVFKIVAASAALNEGLVTAETLFDCENGTYRYGSRVLHDVHPYGELPFADVIVKSSNIGTVKVAALLAPEVFHSYIKKFGFGQLTDIDLPGEMPGYVRPPEEWSKTSPYNIPIGQEILVTALQMTTAMAVIANGGRLVRPYVVSRIQDSAGITLGQKSPFVKAQVIRPETARTMREILVRVVEEGTGKKAKIQGIPVGGKTGTAQKVLSNRKGYSHRNFMSSFVGFAPAEKPLLVMTVVLDDPKPLYYGGTVAAPIFKEVIESALFAAGYVPENTEEFPEPIAALHKFQESQPLFARADSLAAKP